MILVGITVLPFCDIDEISAETHPLRSLGHDVREIR